MPAPTREVVGDLIGVVARLCYVIELGQRSDLRVGTAAALLANGSVVEAQAILREHLAAHEQAARERAAAWDSIKELAERFSGAVYE